MIIKKALLISFLLFIIQIHAYCQEENRVYIDQNIRDIYTKIIELKLEAAQQLINQGKSKNIDNPMYLFMEDYVDFFRVFINEDIEEFKNLEKNKEERLKLIKTGDQTNPYYRLIQAEIHIHWAMSRLKFEEYYTALLETRKAFRLLRENVELFPEFLENNKGLAMIHAVIGTIPDNYKYLVKFLTGMEGSIPESLREIEALKEFSKKSNYLFKEEVHVIQSLILLHLANNSEEAWKVIEEAELDLENSLAAVFIKANIAKHTGRTDLAIHYLENRPRGEEYVSFHYLELMLGINKLHRLDEDADQHLLNYVQNFKGRNYIKEAYQKLAWHAWIIDSNKNKAKEYFSKCLQNGAKLMDEDQSAYEDALLYDLPEKNFLKARLLFDGGYYGRSLEILKGKSQELKKTDFLRFHYTLARNYQKLGKNNSAYKHYFHIIDNKAFEHSYQMCNAALQCAIMAEEMKEIKIAKQYFEFCLSLTPRKYQKSLHQKAKAGLNRLKMN